MPYALVSGAWRQSRNCCSFCYYEMMLCCALLGKQHILCKTASLSLLFVSSSNVGIPARNVGVLARQQFRQGILKATESQWIRAAIERGCLVACNAGVRKHASHYRPPRGLPQPHSGLPDTGSAPSCGLPHCSLPGADQGRARHCESLF